MNKYNTYFKFLAGVFAFFMLLGMFSGCDFRKPDNQLSSIAQQVEQSELRNSEYTRFLGARTNEVAMRIDIYRALAQAGVTNLLNANISHMGYRMVPRDWVRNEFSKSLRAFFFNNGVLNWYEEGSFHCEDYAMGAVFHARTLNRNSNDRVKGASIAVGRIHYIPDDPAPFGPAHSINFVLLPDRSVLFYEPQLQMEVKLSPAEVRSVFFWEI